ncbi:MAG TPA: branched-chain amino acid ABC transporter permease [Hydrogenophaga sp.]|jgi:predicted branched-subunit amino acid permease|uniref:AzlC family ABC transporter permease n=1 Tax=Hydrogenophaga aromaticivorans TaxID=2610898 RepID=A0A7Y8KWJ3_9BURK|nr:MULTISPECIES: AzlC family ABC transporter permease [Hydrogenophaga]MBU4183160.1 AzlC family ABC transporter permease [Gammaproteobacteria bacterium]OGA78420.1 MAG: branched-chain amino acid ABC transporter permease [Burkholderiales bacterium GWE1_65_30]OGA92538.1 MAG: branched-chain amino acid ABC transporter permease [Burkholderiales bacterium GWF1_66_17]OGB24205.1 MAG: branched-chain amino acid ABC transporter permease [Burkholderiales bacterium RIFCSPHIGHO2_02_FULL_66_10]OGB37115.1 MAG: 
MFYLREHRQRAEFWEGVRDQGTVAMGIGAWGLMTGVAMVKSGLSVLEALLMTLIVYAGSAQLAAVPMIAAGAPLWVILTAAFCVNLRFVVFSAHLRPYLMHLPRWQRLVSGYVTGDLSYVFFARRFPKPGQSPDELARQQAYLMGNCAVNYIAWMVASVVGIVLANAIPTEWGLGFAGILALLGVLSSLASSPLRIVSAGVAGAAAVVAWALPLKLNILVAIASAVAICLVLEKAMPHRPAAGAPHV